MPGVVLSGADAGDAERAGGADPVGAESGVADVAGALPVAAPGVACPGAPYVPALWRFPTIPAEYSAPTSVATAVSTPASAVSRPGSVDQNDPPSSIGRLG